MKGSPRQGESPFCGVACVRGVAEALFFGTFFFPAVKAPVAVWCICSSGKNLYIHPSLKYLVASNYLMRGFLSLFLLDSVKDLTKCRSARREKWKNR